MSETEKKQENNGIYREKAMQRVSSPESLNDYIRVVSPSVWIVVAAMIILLLGILGWAIFGTVDAKDAAGQISRVHPISYITN